MKKTFTAGLILLGFAALTVSAQDWYHDRDERFREGGDWRMHMFERIRMDIEHVQETSPWKAQREAHRLQRTKEELTDLQGKLAGHRFDGHELQDVIDSLNKSANDTRLSPQDKAILADDLNKLRSYRDNHEHWGDRDHDGDRH
jgi:hypothetical protein